MTKGERTSRHIDVNRDNSVASADNRVAVVVVPTAVCATSHTDNPTGVGHLVINLSESGSHLVGQGPRDDHDVGLPGGGTEDDT